MKKWLLNQDGQDVVEYALLICVVALAVTASIQDVAQQIAQTLGAISSTLSTAL